ncbi:myosin heavy chain kinase C-like isoform 2-T3 [Discoglossus pictus]
MRRAYRAKDCRTNQDLVIKLNIYNDNSLNQAMKNVKTQERCRQLAEKFNKHSCVVKKITFAKVKVIMFLSGRLNGQYSTMEKYMDGHYEKHNANYVSTLYEDFAITQRNTPQAFSHFTLVSTNHEELACDIQGVGDEYTDPQIHTIKEDPTYSDGNLGWKGIWIFQAFHKCNSICKALNLKVRQEKSTDVPATEPINLASHGVNADFQRLSLR